MNTTGGRAGRGAGGGASPRATAAVVLVGGQGSRLRPLTASTPKPMLPTAGVPFIGHLLSRIADAGIRRVVLGTSYRAEVFADYLGDGSAFGLQLDCVPEPEPLGTGGGIRHAAHALEGHYDEVMVFNGDILSGVDLGAVVDEHRTSGADATLHLVQVPDPTAFGCVPTDSSGRVRGVPREDAHSADRPGQRRVLRLPPRRWWTRSRPGARSRWSARRSRACCAPAPGCRATSSRPTGSTSARPRRSCAAAPTWCRGSRRRPRCPAPSGPRCCSPAPRSSASATLSDGTTLGRDVVVGDGSRVIGSVVMDGARIGDNVTVTRSVIGPGAVIGDETVVSDAVVGDGVSVGAGCELREGVRLWPGITIPDGGLRFSGSA